MKENVLGNANELKKSLAGGLKIANEKLPENIRKEFGGAKKSVTASYIVNLVMAFVVNFWAANILLCVFLGIALPKMSISMQNNITLGASGALVLGLGVFANTKPLMSFYKRLHGFQKPNFEIENRLTRIIEPICMKANIPLPNIYIQDVDYVNACALGADNVAVTLPLMEFNDDVIAGIMAHEIGHLRNLDSVKSIRVCTMNMVLMLFHNIINKFGRLSAGIARFASGNVRSLFNAITMFFNFLAYLFIFAQILPEKITLMLSRQQEYEADAATVEFGQGANFILGMTAIDPQSAAEKPGIITRIRYVWGSTHPPTHTRIERVEEAMKI